MLKAETPGEWLARKSRDSDIKADSAAHSEISAMLRSHGLDTFFWTFNNSSSSIASRATDDGGHERCPSLVLYLRREADFLDQKIDAHFGNWDDEWPLTSTVRDDLNAILRRHRFGSEYLSQRTFIFLPESWEAVVLDLLGRSMKQKVCDRIADILARSNVGLLRRSKSKPKYVFWQSSRTYYLVFEDAAALAVASQHKEQFEETATAILADADTEKYCSDHRVEMRLTHMQAEDLNLYGLARED